jgi:NADPH:quinone reductase
MSAAASGPTSMTVVEISEYGPAENLVPANRPRPVAAAHEVLVKVRAAGVNGPDIVQRRGHYPPPKGASDLLGLEIAGTVIEVGKGVNRWQVGDAVCALTNGGGYAQYCAVDASHCLPKPAALDWAAAATLPETYFTVWSNIFLPGRLPTAGVLLVHGGAGGIGSTAIQLAASRGARVFTTVADDEQAQFCLSLGATRAINFGNEDFVEIVRADAGGADVVLDIICGDYFERNIKVCRPDAHIVQLAFNGGAKVTANLMPIMLKRLTFTGSTLRSRTDAFKTEVAEQLQAQVWPQFERGELKPVVGQRFALEDAAAAHALMESAVHRGKIVLSVGEN